MLRTQAMMLAAAAAAATLMAAGCDRQSSTPSQSVGTSSPTEIAKPVDKSAADTSNPTTQSPMANNSSPPSQSSTADNSSPTSQSSPPDNSSMAANNGAAYTGSSTASSGADSGNAPMQMASAGNDSSITTKVTQSIMADTSLKAMPIKVDTKDGTVTLSGTVDTADMRMHAHQIAATTPGVAGVVDNLSVKNAG